MKKIPHLTARVRAIHQASPNTEGDHEKMKIPHLTARVRAIQQASPNM
jgi:hypothetical protein